jgi:RimJ/RimL family protein N-acetyltransferase
VVSEALALVSDWAWSALPEVTRLWMPIYARNLGSQAVAASAGYVLEGRLPWSVRKDGRVIDAVLFGRYRPGLPASPEA